jgi:hypothetical protein
MTIRESVIISATATAIWPYLADPVRWADWNEKVVSIGRDRTGPVRLGERFELMARVTASNERKATITAVAVEQPTRATFKYEAVWKDKPQVFEESYTLEAHRQGVKVTKASHIPDAPRLFRVLCWIFKTFGMKARQRPLDALKRLVEGG